MDTGFHLLTAPDVQPLSALNTEDLNAGQLHIWLLDTRRCTQEYLDAALGIMDSLEQTRAQKFIRGKQEYIASRGLLRSVLARYTSQNASALELLRTDKGKPYLAHSDLQFSLSHSGHWVVLALGRTSAIGIDLESIRTKRDMLGIATNYYHPTELAHLQSLPATNQADYFYRLWTLKEAFFKAVGTGISAGLEKAAFTLDGHSIDVAISPELDCYLELGDAQGRNYAGDHWHFQQWAISPNEPQQDYCALAYRNDQQLDTKWFDALTLPAFP